MGQALERQQHLGRSRLDPQPRHLEDAGGPRVRSSQEALHPVVQPAVGQVELIGDPSGLLVHDELGLEDGVDVARGSPLVEGQGDGGAAYDVQLAHDAPTRQPSAQGGQSTQDLKAVHVATPGPGWWRR